MNKRKSLFVCFLTFSLITIACRFIPPAPINPTAVRITSIPTRNPVTQSNLTPTVIPVESKSTCCGWGKYAGNPVLGGSYGVIFDVTLLYENRIFKMWNSWRAKSSIGYSESSDGIHWTPPVAVLGPNPVTGWEDNINRPSVLRTSDGLYHMWYTGQASGKSSIGYATSSDGVNWQRKYTQPILKATLSWEKVAVMAPSVLWDETVRVYRMWYSGGEQYEPDAIGYATSPDGANWTKWDGNPIFTANPNNLWEKYKVTAAHVIHHPDSWYYMFYIGFRDVNTAQIGVARSRDGITSWERLPGNPILRPEPNMWDSEADYKPFVIWDGMRWYLWYNGRSEWNEQIGLAIHEGKDLGFPN